MKIIFSSNIAWSVYNFRKELLTILQNQGHEIHCIANGKEDLYVKLIQNLGFYFHDININNNGKNPIRDLKIILKYIKLYNKLKPDIILHNAIKPNIYGTIAAGILRIPTINNISGLGTLFIKKSFSTRIAKLLYWFSQKFATKVFFQNPHDRKLFIDQKLVASGKTDLIMGSGVDTKRFDPNKFVEKKNTKFHFLFVARLLIDKGIVEYVEAAKAIKTKYENVEFNILGPLYEINETGISKEKLESWIDLKIINYLGTSDRVEGIFSKADCVVLPSYREGLSKVLIEASSMALPIVTTNVPGCKDVVIDNKTGFLCEPRNYKDLQEKMEKMLKLDPIKRDLLGQKGRDRAIKYFDIEIINKKYISSIYEILK